MKRKILFTLLLLFTLKNHAQLTAGDIAFIGFHLDDPDGFTFITLTDIPEGEVIYFTDHSWSVTFNTWHNNPGEAHYSWTAPTGGAAIGSIVTISETATADVLAATTGTISKEAVGGSFSLSQSGDVILAYQSSTGAKPTAANATFIAAIYADDNYAHNTDCDGSQGWYNGTPCASDYTTPGEVSNNGSPSGIPPGLTNGVNAMHLYPSPLLESGSENDNGRYTGTLTGESNAIRGYINDRTKWSMEDDASYDTSVTFFATPSITESALGINPINAAKGFTLYPNPSSDAVKIKSQSEDDFQLIDTLGKTIKVFHVKSNIEKTMDINDLSEGLYFIKSVNNNNVQKLIIKR
tara:strand:+ start:5165 stop:6217 length:1053 start_codon:yes stop_codon:yes gene_type:complete